MPLSRPWCWVPDRPAKATRWRAAGRRRGGCQSPPHADIVRRVADDLGIPVATTDWAGGAGRSLRPDIVAVANAGRTATSR